MWYAGLELENWNLFLFLWIEYVKQILENVIRATTSVLDFFLERKQLLFINS